MKVTILAGSFKSHRIKWAVELSKHAKIHVLTPRYTKDAPAFERINENLEVHRFNPLVRKAPTFQNTAEKIVFSLTGIIASLRLQKKVRSDILHCFSAISSATWGVVTKHIFRCKLIAHALGSDVRVGVEKPHTRFILKHILRNSDGIISCSEEITGLIKSICDKKIVTVYNSIYADYFNPDKVEETILPFDVCRDVVLYSATRLEPFKNPEYLIKAAPLVCAKKPTTLFVFTGGGEYQKDLESMASELGVRDNIVFLGIVDYSKMPYLYKISNIAVALSTTENYGSVSLLEAGASAKPVIVTDVGYTRYLIEDGVNGLVVPLDQPKVLSNTIIKLLEDSTQSSTLGKNLKEIVNKKYETKKNVEEIAGIYSGLMKK